MSYIVCSECRKANPTHILYAKGGYADGPRPIHLECFQKSLYLNNRFTPFIIPEKWPEWLKKNWGMDD